jgi:hypothetical protein
MQVVDNPWNDNDKPWLDHAFEPSGGHSVPETTGYQGHHRYAITVFVSKS